MAALLLVPSTAPWLGPSTGRADAFPDHSDPRVGSTLATSPSEVRIWFDGEIEPVFSTIRVENSDKQRVDPGDGGVTASRSSRGGARSMTTVPAVLVQWWSLVAVVAARGNLGLKSGISGWRIAVDASVCFALTADRRRAGAGDARLGA